MCSKVTLGGREREGVKSGGSGNGDSVRPLSVAFFLIFEHSQVLTNTEKEEGNNGSDFKPKPGSHFDKGFSSW